MSVSFLTLCWSFSNGTVRNFFHVSNGTFRRAFIFATKVYFYRFWTLIGSFTHFSQPKNGSVVKNTFYVSIGLVSGNFFFEKNYFIIIIGKWAGLFTPIVEKISGVIKTAFYLSIGIVSGKTFSRNKYKFQSKPHKSVKYQRFKHAFFGIVCEGVFYASIVTFIGKKSKKNIVLWLSNIDWKFFTFRHFFVGSVKIERENFVLLSKVLRHFAKIVFYTSQGISSRIRVPRKNYRDEIAFESNICSFNNLRHWAIKIQPFILNFCSEVVKPKLYVF